MSSQVMLTPMGEVKLAGFHFSTDMLGVAQLTRNKTDDYKVKNSQLEITM